MKKSYTESLDSSTLPVCLFYKPKPSWRCKIGWMILDGSWRYKLCTLTVRRGSTDLIGDLYKPDSRSFAEANSRTSELMAGGWLLGRGHVHPHVIIRKVQSCIFCGMSVAKCRAHGFRCSGTLALLGLWNPGVQIPRIQRLLGSFRWFGGISNLEFKFVLRFG